MMLESFNPNVFVDDPAFFTSLQEEKIISFSLEADRNFEDLKLCVIPVLVEGNKCRQAFDFLIDTGSEVTVLNKNVAKIVGVTLESTPIGAQGMGGKSAVWKGLVASIEIVQRIELDGDEIDKKIVLEYSSVIVGDLLGKFSEYSILGILGTKTIQDICLKIDYPKKYLEFSKIISLKVDGSHE